MRVAQVSMFETWVREHLIFQRRAHIMDFMQGHSCCRRCLSSACAGDLTL